MEHEKLWEMRQRHGMTLQAIGDAVGVTRQAVWLSLMEHYRTTKILDFLYLCEVCRLLCFSPDKILRATKLLNLNPIKKGGRNYLFSNADVEKLRQSLVCRHCGKPLPTHHRSYCEECARKRARYPYPFYTEEMRDKIRGQAREKYKRQALNLARNENELPVG